MTSSSPTARPRIVDAELDELMAALPAIVLEGPKGVGKTFTAMQRAKTVHALDDPARRSIIAAEPARALAGSPPILIDEWQQVPEVWDLVRRRVDEGAEPGAFLLTGSAFPKDLPTHSGAGRIVTIRMRPLTLAERTEEAITVSLSELLTGERPALVGRTSWGLDEYVAEILRSGLPGIRPYEGRASRAALDGYLERVVDRGFPDELGRRVRDPETLRRWMRAYASASSTTATLETIREAATPGQSHKPSRRTTQLYRDALSRLWLLDEVSAWVPTRNHIRRLSTPPKHQLVDPALAARLLDVNAEALLAGSGTGPTIPRDGTLLGALFESLVVQSVRVYAQDAEAQVSHLRTGGGDHEIDLIVERRDRRVLALEVKLARNVVDADCRQLRWLRDRVGEELLDAAVITTGEEAYRRPDGIAVIPASLLGP